MKAAAAVLLARTYTTQQCACAVSGGFEPLHGYASKGNRASDRHGLGGLLSAQTAALREISTACWCIAIFAPNDLWHYEGSR